MIQVFPIEFIREIIRQTLLREKLKRGNDNYIGGDNEINIFSFYEQLSTHDEVDRYVENYRALTKQQNKSDLIANGVLTCPSAPSITNLYSATIIPMDWSLFVRTTLGNRDQVVYSFNNLIEVLNGRAHDLALLTCRDENGKIYYQPFMLPRVGNDNGPENYSQEIGLATAPRIESGMFIGVFGGTVTSYLLEQRITNLENSGYVSYLPNGAYLYYRELVGSEYVVRVAVKTSSTESSMFQLNVQDDGTYPEIIFPPTHEGSELYKVSMSFEALRGDTPRNLNSEEVWDMNISGSATLASANTLFGNDMIRLAISTYGVKGNPNTIYSNPPRNWLEPLELGSGLSANTNPYQVLSKFQPNTHTDAISNTITYTFVVNKSGFVYKLWLYGRYGVGFFNQGTLVSDNISPNTIFKIEEFYMSSGSSNKMTYYAKLVDAIEVNNTEGDTMTISATFQIQGDID